MFQKGPLFSRARCLLLISIYAGSLFAQPLSPKLPGGVTLLQPKEISIERQDVSISPEIVTISYVFRNNFALDFFQMGL